MLLDGLTLISHWLSGDLVGWGGEGWHELQGILGGISGIYLAIGVVIGAAFGKIVSSFVNDILTPILGLLVGGISFTNLEWVIGWDPDHPAVIGYGVFLPAVFDFVIIAFAIFFLIRALSALKRRQDQAPVIPPPPSPEVQLVTYSHR